MLLITTFLSRLFILLDHANLCDSVKLSLKKGGNLAMSISYDGFGTLDWMEYCHTTKRCNIS